MDPVWGTQSRHFSVPVIVTTPDQETFSPPGSSSRITSPDNSQPAQPPRVWGRLPQSHLSVSRDMDQFSIITTTELTSPAAIRERILSKLHVYDDDYSACRLYRTYIGESLEDINGPEISDDELWDLCANQKKGDSIILLVRQVKPTDSAPVSATREHSGHVFPPHITTEAVHNKSGSLGSSSTLSENLVNEFFLNQNNQPGWHGRGMSEQGPYSQHLDPSPANSPHPSVRDRTLSDLSSPYPNNATSPVRSPRQRTMDELRSPYGWSDQTSPPVHMRGPRSPNPPRHMSEEGGYGAVPRAQVQAPTPTVESVPANQRPIGYGPSGPFLHPAGVTGVPRGLPPTPGQASNQRTFVGGFIHDRMGPSGVGSGPGSKGLQSAKSMNDMRKEANAAPPGDGRSKSPTPTIPFGPQGPLPPRHVSANANMFPGRYQPTPSSIYGLNVANAMGGSNSASNSFYRPDGQQNYAPSPYGRPPGSSPYSQERPGNQQIQSSPDIPRANGPRAPHPQGARSLPAEPQGYPQALRQPPPAPGTTPPLTIPNRVRAPSEKSSGSSSSIQRANEEGPYDGMQRPGSAASRRSDHSAPSTPATDLSLKKAVESTLDTTTVEADQPWSIEGDDDSEEDDVDGSTWIRPPPSKEKDDKAKEEGEEGEGTMKADDMNKMLSRIQSMNEDGEGTLKEDANPPKVKFADPPKPDDNKDEDQTLVDDDNSGGGVAFIEDDGSDEDEDDGSGGTWVRPPTSVVIPASSSSSSTPSTPSVRPLPTIPGGLNMKEKPSLKLTMGLPIDGKGPASASQASAVLRTARSPQEDEQPQEHLRPSGRRGPRRNNTSSSNSSTGSGSPIVRKTSFAVRGEKDNWAFRPSVEDVYEHMEEFFPDHDLDKEFIDTAAAGAASTEDSSSSSPTTEKPPAQGLAPPSRGIGHKKSIRRIAQDGRKRLQKAGMMKDVPAVGAGAGGGAGLLRRKSTKLWGSKMEEVTPGAAARMRKQPAMNAIPESPTEEEAANLSFKWVKGDLIGKGTYGQVYLALNATTGEMLAVKQVAIPQTDSDREDKRQTGVVDALVSEVELLKDLDHPNIVQYLGMERTDLNLNVFLEYVTGGSVGRCLRKHGKFEESVVKSFTSQILDGLEYLHTKNILHRDLKADNILVDLAGVCKISDFGISKRSDNIYEINANMSLQGSIFWMAPEVVSNQKKGYSAKIDIWSLGCVVLEMFCGRRPWSDEEAIQAMFKLGAERLAPPVPSDVTLSQVAAHFLSNCFIVDSEQRPTAARLLQHVFVEIPKDWSFEQTNLGRAIKKPKKLKK